MKEMLEMDIKVGTWKCCRKRPLYIIKEANGNRFLYCERCLAREAHKIDMSLVKKISNIVKFTNEKRKEK